MRVKDIKWRCNEILTFLGLDLHRWWMNIYLIYFLNSFFIGEAFLWSFMDLHLVFLCFFNHFHKLYLLELIWIQFQNYVAKCDFIDTSEKLWHNAKQVLYGPLSDGSFSAEFVPRIEIFSEMEWCQTGPTML